ncbi:hypothetical protein LTS18_003248 [Coniosporium uncinatum]|uniref:Uncharacterized protein n=1 Tax=Coniosporium uncinatum TaxID=93489 RepID=A0ACC3D6Z3_9PEZI|nr:hypothetical protein LTS18_003248 [Coniosporium uncinatum]
MSDADNPSVTVALAQYRRAILEHNLTVFRTCIADVEQNHREPSPDNAENEATQENLMDHISRSLDVYSAERLSFIKPQDYLTHWDKLVKIGTMNGMTRRDAPAEEKAALRDEHLPEVRDLIMNSTEGTGFEALHIPAKFIELISQVDELTGPGFSRYREAGGCHWFTGCDVYGVEIQSTVDELREALTSSEVESEVMAGWQTGYGDGTYGHVMYCRCEETGKDWGWRYFLIDMETLLEVYDTLEDFHT